MSELYEKSRFNDSSGIQPSAGIRVLVPDGRSGTLMKWPLITNDGLVKVNLEDGGCYVCKVADLEIDPSFPLMRVPPGQSFGISSGAGQQQMANLEPE